MAHILFTLSPLLILASALTANNCNLHYAGSLSGKSKCDAVFADMHDGDKKRVTIIGENMTIVPNENNETWVVHAIMDITHWNATVDFNVPGKPNPPPVHLTATFWRMSRSSATSKHKMALEFTDPSETLAKSTIPLNVWLMIE